MVVGVLQVGLSVPPAGGAGVAVSGSPVADDDVRLLAQANVGDHARRTADTACRAEKRTADATISSLSGTSPPRSRNPDLRCALKPVGAAGMFTFGSVPVRELARQRVRFVSRLLRAAGYADWGGAVRTRSSSSAGTRPCSGDGPTRSWRGGSAEIPTTRRPPLAAVLAMTDDFEAAVLVGKDDRTRIPQRLRDRQSPEWAEVADLAARGIRHIERDLVLLDPPDAAELDRTYSVLKALHGAAYGWDPPDVGGLERLRATRMRQYVRAWISGWDLVRLDPGYRPETEVVEVSSSYAEDSTLEDTAREDSALEDGASEDTSVEDATDSGTG